MGQRVEKEVIRNADTTKTLYVHDASGNIMAIYTLRNNDTLKLQEVPLYGSSRLGVWNANKVLRIDSVLHETEIEEQDPQDPATEGVTYIAAGEKQYELSNHLGNVLATVSDRKIPYYVSGALDHYKAEQITGNEYYAFGSPMPERKYSVGGYRFGFNGKESDNEVSGQGNQYDYGFRIYNPRIAKFLSVDPLTKEYPWYTPYQFAGNTPIRAVDLDGLEELDYRVVMILENGDAIVEVKTTQNVTSRSNQSVMQMNNLNNGQMRQPETRSARLNQILEVGSRRENTNIVEGVGSGFNPTLGTLNWYIQISCDELNSSGVRLASNDPQGNYFPLNNSFQYSQGNNFVFIVPADPAPQSLSPSINLTPPVAGGTTEAFTTTVLNTVNEQTSQLGQTSNDVTSINVSYPDIPEYNGVVGTLQNSIQTTYPNANVSFTPTPVDAATGNSALSVSAVGSPKQNLTTD